MVTITTLKGAKIEMVVNGIGIDATVNGKQFRLSSDCLKHDRQLGWHVVLAAGIKAQLDGTNASLAESVIRDLKSAQDAYGKEFAQSAYGISQRLSADMDRSDSDN